MDFADQAFGDRPAVIEIVADKLEGVTVIEQFPHVVGIGSLHGFAGQQAPRLLQGQPCALDMRSVMRLQQKGAGTHGRQPVLGESRRLQKAARPLDARQPCRHPVGDVE